MEMKQVLVVGCGSIGRRHARLLSGREDVALELCEMHPESLARTLEEVGPVPACDSYERALERGPDAVVIATPTEWHAEQALAALAAGAHVLCEKPMSDTVENSQRMLQAAARSDRVFSVGFCLHFHPAMQRIRELIRVGKVGEVQHVHWHVGSYLTLMNSVSRHQARQEGALLLDYAHQPDLLHWWLGEMPGAVYAAGHQGGDLPLSSNPNVAAITLEYGRGLLATINLNFVQHPDRSFCEITGDQGWIAFDLKSNQLRLGQRADESETLEDFAMERDDMYVDEHQAFFDAVEGKRPPESPAEEAIVSMQIIEAAMDSWRKKQRVNLGG